MFVLGHFLIIESSFDFVHIIRERNTEYYIIIEYVYTYIVYGLAIYWDGCGILISSFNLHIMFILILIVQ